MSSLPDRRESYRLAMGRASAWLVSQQQADGSFGAGANNLSALETSAICLQMNGYPENAARLLRYVRRHLTLPDGSFRQALPREAHAEWVYAPSWTVISAHLNGFFDLSFPAMADILRFQDLASGGVFGHPEHQQRGSGVIVPSVTAVAGTAALVTGTLASAVRIGDYFLRLIAMQPDLEHKFYPFYDTRLGLITEGVPELGPTYFGTFERQAPGQHYWLIGFIIAFLSDLYLATGRHKYLAGAMTMFEFALGCNRDRLTNTLNHKYCWGCARLYAASGDHRALDEATQVADFLVKVQEPAGTWWHSGFIPVRSDQSRLVDVEGASQFSIWLGRLLQVME